MSETSAEPLHAAGRRRGLGRGLSALLGDDDPGLVASHGPGRAASDSGARQLPVDALEPGPWQPRRHFEPEALAQLAESIRTSGVLQPLLVRADPDRPGRYQIIAGERRWRAAQQARLHEVPAEIRNFSDEQALEVALVENVQRQDLSPLEEAEGYRRLIDQFGYTQEVLAGRIGKSRAHIANTLRLLGLPEMVRGLVIHGKLSAGHARALLGLEDAEALAQEAVQRALSVRDVERLAQRRKAAAGSAPKGPALAAARVAAAAIKDPDTRKFEQMLEAQLGLKVSIAGGEPGTLTISYQTLEQLDDVVQKLMI